jgi:hypothetical protein
LPNRWVTRVTIHPDSANVCYVTLSGYKVDSTGAHIFRTTNYGTNWISISGNLPDAPINEVVIDPFTSGKLYIGTDYGVMVTTNLGQSWAIMGNGLPSNVPVHDLTIHAPTAKMIAWTHGRSTFSIDIAAIQGIGSQSNIANDFKLYQNYPNPFNPSTKIKFSIPQNGNTKLDNGIVTLKIYNILGREIETLMNEKLNAGTYEIKFSGDKLASGIYFYKLTTDKYSETKKMIFMK